MQFKKWLKINEVGPGGGGPGSGLEPPKQDPTQLGGTNAFADYHEPGSDELPPVNKKSKKKSNKKMKREGLWYNDEAAPDDARRKKKPWEERGTRRPQPQTKGAMGMPGAMPGMMPGAPMGGGMPPKMMKKKSNKKMNKK